MVCQAGQHIRNGIQVSVDEFVCVCHGHGPEESDKAVI